MPNWGSTSGLRSAVLSLLKHTRDSKSLELRTTFPQLLDNSPYLADLGAGLTGADGPELQKVLEERDIPKRLHLTLGKMVLLLVLIQYLSLTMDLLKHSVLLEEMKWTGND